MQLAFNTFELEPEEVRSRFQAALVSGRPLWLWPQMTVGRWQAALRSIETTVRGVLGYDGYGNLLCDDSEALGIACYTSGTGPLLGFWAEKGLISASPAIAALLALHLEHNRLRLTRMTRAASDVVSALAAMGVEVTVLKGMHTAYIYFPQPGVRPLSDIDLLIAPSDEAAAGKVLSSLGFEPGKFGRWPPQRVWRLRGTPREPRTLCFAHAEDPWTIDLQTSLSRRPPGDGREARLEEVRREFSCARWTCNPQAARVLDQPLLLLQLAVHASCGMESLTILRMIELIMVIRRDQRSRLLSWTEFLDLGQRTGALGYAYPALQLCESISPGTVPVDVLDQCRATTPEMVRRIVDGMEPALAQRVDRCSIAERYMWADTWALKARQFAGELVPPNVTSIADLYENYRKRFWRLVRRTVTW